MESRPEESYMDEEWENRKLCPDGNCIGVIGPDGFCKECGRGLPSETDQPVVLSVSGEPGGEYEEEYVDERAGEFHADGEEDGGLNDAVDEDWENRTLCSDESCIGVIGPDGRCRECGKPL